MLQNIFNARIKFLNKDDECFSDLGTALHYLQDQWTLRPRTADKHTAYEYSIEKEIFLDDTPQLVNLIKSLAIPQKAIDAYLGLLQELNTTFNPSNIAEVKKHYHIPYTVIELTRLPRPTTWSTPILDLNFAYRFSLVIASLVLLRPLQREGWDVVTGVDQIKANYYYHGRYIPECAYCGERIFSKDRVVVRDAGYLAQELESFYAHFECIKPEIDAQRICLICKAPLVLVKEYPQD